ncbi:MAG: low molecular weight protein-tyrosine-phosphatase [Flaviflexus sp.]|uniref:low molecular weight protein-tyrosine-phosphatase n=1 Tax=Flaviflexus sp. TaxID=1969482 RepID=UPI00352D24A6
MRILVVCTGNICRSPMGEIVLRQKLADVGIDADVDSVGVSSEEHGRPVDRRAANVLRESGYDVPSRRARKVTKADLEESDLVLAMTVGHAQQLGALADRYGIDKSKIHLWREYDADAGLSVAPDGVFGEGGYLSERDLERSYSSFYSSDGEWDVPDPWYGGQEGFYDTLAVVESGADGIIDSMSNS